jgi:hypothetical protein
MNYLQVVQVFSRIPHFDGDLHPNLSHFIGLSCLFFKQGWPGVINVGTLSKLRRLVLRDGMSVRQASRRLGISRNTATKWLSAPEMVEPQYPVRQAAASVLDPFKEQL